MKRIDLPILITALGQLELTNAFALCLFRKVLSGAQIKGAEAMLREDIAGGVVSVAPLGAAAFERAQQIARKHTARLGTRTADVLHVASALTLRSDTFCTFDQRQSKLATAEGLQVIFR